MEANVWIGGPTLIWAVLTNEKIKRKKARRSFLMLNPQAAMIIYAKSSAIIAIRNIYKGLLDTRKYLIIACMYRILIGSSG